MRLTTFTCTTIIMFFISCNNAADKNNQPVTETAKKNLNVANTNYKPAFEGQTRIAAVTTAAAYKTDSLAGKLGRPWGIIAYPGNRLLITDKTGFMQLLDAEGKLIKKITGFPATDANKQGGLLDVALDPLFEQNHTLYWTFTEKFGTDTTTLTAVAKGTFNETDSTVKNVKIIFRAMPALNSSYHFGSRLLFDKEGFLFVSAGERSVLEGRKQAQWLNSGYGKIFRITKDGKPAPGNPFIGQKDAMPQIYSYGHRNPQSLDINPETGDLWEAEFGPRGGDELNIIKAGKNYGWPIITYGIEYNGNKIGDSIQQKEGMEQPVYYWDPVLSPGGMIFYTGDGIPEWKNNLFICGLSSTHIARLVIKNNKVVGEESLLSEKKERLRDITQLNNNIYVVTDDGNLYRISSK